VPKKAIKNFLNVEVHITWKSIRISDIFGNELEQ
jgi:hypothetical protein